MDGKTANGPEAVAPTFAKLGYACPLLAVYTLSGPDSVDRRLGREL